MKELFYKLREKGYSRFGPYFGICPMLLLAGGGMVYKYFQEKVIFFAFTGAMWILFSILFFVVSMKNRKKKE